MTEQNIKAHKRRFSRFVELAGHASPNDDAVVVLHKDGKAKTKEDKRSKRGEKRKAKLAKIKAIREHQKHMKALAKAKQKDKPVEAKDIVASATSTSDPSDKSQRQEPAKKRRKLDEDGKPRRKRHQPPASISRNQRDERSGNRTSAGVHDPAKLAGKYNQQGKQKQRQKSRGVDESVLKIFD